MDSDDSDRQDMAPELHPLEEIERLEKFLEHVGGALGLIGPDCRIIWTNKATENNYQLNGPVAGLYCKEVMDPSEEQCRECPIPKAFKSGQTETTIMETWLLPGDSRFYQFTATPIIEADGTISQVMLLGQHVTERVKGELEIQKRNEMLEQQNRHIMEINRQKTQFLASVSHELRTPLTSIIGFTEILLEDTDDILAGRHRQMLRKVSQNAERLLTMINDLLDLSKIEDGKMTVTPTRVSLPILVRQVIETMQPLIRDKDLKITADIPNDLPMMRTDEQKLSQVMVNLVSNAIKFTPQGSVTIRASLEESKICLQVTDTGIGIRRDDFKKIFEEFRQIDSTTNRSGGTGLGLSITKRLVYLLGGNIKVSSKVGEGSTFTITIPVILNKSLISRRNRLAQKD